MMQCTDHVYELGEPQAQAHRQGLREVVDGPGGGLVIGTITRVW